MDVCLAYIEAAIQVVPLVQLIIQYHICRDFQHQEWSEILLKDRKITITTIAKNIGSCSVLEHLNETMYKPFSHTNQYIYLYKKLITATVPSSMEIWWISITNRNVC